MRFSSVFAPSGVVLSAVFLTVPTGAWAQNAPAAPPAEREGYAPGDDAPPPTPALEAPPQKKKYWNDIDNSFFAGRFSIAAVADVAAYSQNSVNKEQIGKLDPTLRWRGDRLLLSGKFKTSPDPTRWLRFMISANYNGLDRIPDDSAFSLTDLTLTYPTGKWSQIALGKQREGIQLEMLGVSTTFTFMERATASTAFMPTRNDGIRFYGQGERGRLTYSLGYFNLFLTNGLSFNDSGSQIAFRISGLPEDKGDRELIHTALGIRYSDDKKGKLRYKAKPEVDSGPNVIDTGDFKARNATTFSVENAVVRGPFAFRAEGMFNRVTGTDSGDVWLHGYYADLSYVLTGQNRKYDRSSGSFGRIQLAPGSRGAWEVGLRHSDTNLSAGTIRGGRFNRTSLALSYFQDVHWRYEFNYGYGKLDRKDQKGDLHIFQARIQYEL